MKPRPQSGRSASLLPVWLPRSHRLTCPLTGDARAVRLCWPRLPGRLTSSSPHRTATLPQLG
eukprot:2273330-Alexandrium_andersonii.AAC.1